jgi:hypothetical protein
MGWVITVGHAVNQFLIHIATSNRVVTVASKKDIPANFEDFEVVDGLVLENMIETSGALLTYKLTMIKSRTTSLGTNFSDYTKMCLASEEDLHDLIEKTVKEYLIQVNRWLVRTIHGAIYPDGHTTTTATNKLIHIVESPNIQKILNGESTGTEGDWSMEELWRLPVITMYAKLAYKYEGFVDVLNGTFMEEISGVLLSATTSSAKGIPDSEICGRNHAAVARGRSTETCTKCGKVGHGTSQCFQSGDDLAAKAEAMAKEAAAILAKRKTSSKINDAEVKAYSAGYVANKDDEEYVSRASAVLPIHVSPTTKLTSPSSIVIYHGHLSPTQIAVKKYEGSVACSVILDQKLKFVPDTIIDSTVMMNVEKNTSRQVADVVFSIKTKAKKPYVLVTKGTTLVLDKTKDNILSLPVLSQSGFKVDFAIGTVDDLSFRGVLTTPTGARATLFFENNLWRVPMAFLPTITASTSQVHISDDQNIQASSITIPEISSKIATCADRQPTCTSKDGKTASTIRNVIVDLQHNDTNTSVPMGPVMTRLQSTDIQDYIEQSYGSLLHFVQESSYASHFQITSEPGIDFNWDSASQDRSIPESMILEFLNMTGIKLALFVSTALRNLASLFLFRIL